MTILCFISAEKFGCNHKEGVTRPFVLLPPLEEKEKYLPGERFSLSFTLFGDGIDHFPYFITVLEEIGEEGIGKGKNQVELRQVFVETLQGDYIPIYNREKRELLSNIEICTGTDVCRFQKEYSDAFSIYFQTPLRMKNREHFLLTPEFPFIVRGLIRRLNSLLYFHHGQILLDLDFTEYIRHAQTIQLTENQTRWEDWERYSNRQQESLKMGGIIGKADYCGQWQIFYPLLKLGEWMHLGKSSVFGLGKIKIVPH